MFKVQENATNFSTEQKLQDLKEELNSEIATNRDLKREYANTVKKEEAGEVFDSRGRFFLVNQVLAITFVLCIFPNSLHLYPGLYWIFSDRISVILPIKIQICHVSG